MAVDIYAIGKDRFSEIRPRMKFIISPDLDAQNRHFARALVDRIKANEAEGKPTRLMLPTGPVNYEWFVKLVNEEKVSLANVYGVMMDEFCDADGNCIPEDHPLSFRKFIRGLLLDGVNEPLRMKDENLQFPDGRAPEATTRLIDEIGGIDVTYPGIGIDGHLAFNEPPRTEEDATEENIRHSRTRIIPLAPETVTQYDMAGTTGNLDMIPRLAVTVGMEEMLAAREVHMYLLRNWHAGIMRKALFGPVTPWFPASYVQTHPDVTVHMPEYVTVPPSVNVTLNVTT